jgi:hypothetical protein
MLNILAQASAAVDPGNCPFNDPPARLHLKPNLLSWTRHNLDRDTKDLGGPFD